MPETHYPIQQPGEPLIVVLDVLLASLVNSVDRDRSTRQEESRLGVIHGEQRDFECFSSLTVTAIGWVFHLLSLQFGQTAFS